VSVLVAVLALVNGLQSAFKASGNPLNILVMRKGSNSELSGGLTRDAFESVKAKPGIARGADGLPLASLELITVINLPSESHPDGMNITLRGLTQTGLAIREQTKIDKGRWFRAGQREVVVGKSIAKRYPDAELGKKLHFGRGDWEVVGVMDSDSSATNSEIYADFNQMAGDFNRQDGPSSALIRATDAVAAQALVNSINDDQRLNSNARTEVEYMDSQTNSAARHNHGGWIEFRGDEHDVCGRGPARERSGNAARVGIFAGQHSYQLFSGISAVIAAGRRDRLRAGAAAE
jgi:putative ABC transport system permease protein